MGDASAVLLTLPGQTAVAASCELQPPRLNRYAVVISRRHLLLIFQPYQPRLEAPPGSHILK